MIYIPFSCCIDSVGEASAKGDSVGNTFQRQPLFQDYTLPTRRINISQGSSVIFDFIETSTYMIDNYGCRGYCFNEKDSLSVLAVVCCKKINVKL